VVGSKPIKGYMQAMYICMECTGDCNDRLSHAPKIDNSEKLLKPKI